jgi:putative ABC transport system permease protein
MNHKNIRLAFRNILKNKGVSSINILGMAIGMTAVLLIFQFIGFEKSYDRFFKNASNIQRLVFFRHYQTGLDVSVGNNYYIGQIAAEKIPDIKKFCRVKKETLFFRSLEQTYKEEMTLFADSSFFDIFSHKILSGDKSAFLRQPNTVVITESTARKYFGSENPVGKLISAVNPGNRPLTVQGVVEDVPENSHLKFNIIISLATFTNNSYCYSCNNTNTYFLLKEGSDKSKIEREITQLGKENFSSRDIKLDFPIEFRLQPVTDIHLHSAYRFEFETNGNAKYLSVLLIIALLILLSAGFNYFNLYSSVTGKRINVIGIRIINGASRRDIIYEFITEALITGMISLLLAFALLFLFFPFLKDLLSLNFTTTSLFNLRTWLLPSSFLLALSLMAGLLLGLKIYNVTPVTFIRKDIRFNTRKKSRRLLLAGQFIIAIVLIGCTIGALRQISYMQREAFTMNINKTLVVKRPTTKEFNTAQKSFQEALLKHPGISEITYSTIIPGEKNSWVKGGISIKGKEKLGFQFFQADVAPNFFRFFNVKLLAGRQFFDDENNWLGGSRHLILNKEAALALGDDKFENCIGKTLFDSDAKEDIGEVVGVIDGYFQNSLDQEVKPTLFNCDQVGYYIFIRFSNPDIKNIVDKVTDEFRNHFMDSYFEYFFLDNYFNSQYKGHIQLFRCFILFSLMAVIITSLSLFGLVMMATVSRTKEIGIRKLNGAKVSEILYLLNREFIILITISYIIAIPAIWITMYKWLQGFAYRIDITLWLFVLAGLITFGIALITVSWLSWKTATRNPVEALRFE